MTPFTIQQELCQNGCNKYFSMISKAYGLSVAASVFTVWQDLIRNLPMRQLFDLFPLEKALLLSYSSI
jgi:hypothetical protein